MPETGSAQGALPLRSAYPARDLTHSKGRRAISPDKTTGSFRRRFVPEPGVLNGKGKTRPFACARSSFLAVRARKAPSPRPDTGFLHAVLAGPDGTFPAIRDRYRSVRSGLSRFKDGGGYKANRQALEALVQKACRWDAKAGKPVFLIQEARPSFCSSACYLLLLKALETWDSGRSGPVISERAWLALMPRIGQHDGDGPWGWANANGPGFAVLVHSLGAGVNFEDWGQARPGDFMKIFWTDHIGRRESGHLTVLVKDGGDEVTFWSSNVPDGYGARTVPKSKIKRVIFTRITRPERFNLAPSIGHHAWLASLLKQDVSMKEVRRHCGMKEP